MSKEIERKFLVKPDYWHLFQEGKLYSQGYLFSDKDKVVRVRLIDDKGFLAVKSKRSGFTRDEFEYEIPFSDAEYMMNNFCTGSIIKKYRSELLINNLLWEVDKFVGENEGLVMAEIELEDEKQFIILPEWADREVTADSRYYNSNLAENPFCNWINS